MFEVSQSRIEHGLGIKPHLALCLGVIVPQLVIGIAARAEELPNAFVLYFLFSIWAVPVVCWLLGFIWILIYSRPRDMLLAGSYAVVALLLNFYFYGTPFPL